MKIKLFSFFFLGLSFPFFSSFGFPVEGTCEELKSAALDGIYEAIQTNALTRQYIDQNYADLGSLESAILQGGDSDKYRSYVASLRVDDVYMSSQALYTDTYLNSLFSSVNRFDCSESCDSPTNECCELVVEKLQGITDIISLIRGQISYNSQYLAQIQEYTYYIRNYTYYTAYATMAATNYLDSIDYNVNEIAYDTYLLQTDMDWLITNFYPLLKSINENVSNAYHNVNLVLTNEVNVIVTNNFDVSRIVSAIDDAKTVLDDSLTSLYRLQYSSFFNITNSLNTINSNVTNSFYKLLGGSTPSNPYFTKFNWWPQEKGIKPSTSYETWGTKSYDSSKSYLYNFWNLLNQDIQGKILSLNNYWHAYRVSDFPVLTNTVGAIHRDTTNYFSFFRGEIGVRGVLEDWQSQQVSGSYHDFLTNHYLTVVRGGSLSGNQSSKTNWFSRIETLLAALVFTDSSETNTVDTSAGIQERSQLQSSYQNVNQSASTFSDSFSQTSDSIVSLYRSYFNTFDSAAMPSHIVLMRITADPSDEIEITFQSDSISVLVEACRVVSTFCWSSVGIFLLYKFLVWAARCISVACQFIYRVISSVFK